MKKLRANISRRGFIRGAGIAMALPWLESFVPVLEKSATAAAVGKVATAAPIRVGFMFFPNGVWQDAWVPKKSGPDYTLPFSLSPLAEVKKEVLVLSGLDKAHSRKGDGHYAKTANFLTGLTVEKTTGKNINSGGVSVDQLIAKKIGNQTPLPSLELGIDQVVSGIDPNVGYTRLYGSYISWESGQRPVAKEINPKLVYERLFSLRRKGSFTAQTKQRAEDKRVLLDMALEDAREVRRQLSRDDQHKLDEYLDSVRSVEKKIKFMSSDHPERWKPTSPEPKIVTPVPSDPENFREHVKLMLDLTTLAFWSDSTRIMSFMFANSVSGHNFTFLDGVQGSHHEMSHHENRKEKIAQYKRITRWHVEQYVYLLNRLKNIQEGESTLLDNSMIMMGSGFSDGNRHDPNNLPILLGGRGGHRIETGQHIASKKNTPLCNLYVSMLQAMNLSVDSFGDSTGPIPGVLKS